MLLKLKSNVNEQDKTLKDPIMLINLTVQSPISLKNCYFWKLNFTWYRGGQENA